MWAHGFVLAQSWGWLLDVSALHLFHFGCLFLAAAAAPRTLGVLKSGPVAIEICSHLSLSLDDAAAFSSLREYVLYGTGMGWDGIHYGLSS